MSERIRIKQEGIAIVLYEGLYAHVTMSIEEAEEFLAHPEELAQVIEAAKAKKEEYRKDAIVKTRGHLERLESGGY